MSKHTKLKTKMNILFNLFKLSDVRIGGQACGGLLPLIGGGPLLSVVAKEKDYVDSREMTMEDNSLMRVMMMVRKRRRTRKKMMMKKGNLDVGREHGKWQKK